MLQSGFYQSFCGTSRKLWLSFGLRVQSQVENLNKSQVPELLSKIAFPLTLASQPETLKRQKLNSTTEAPKITTRSTLNSSHALPPKLALIQKGLIRPCNIPECEALSVRIAGPLHEALKPSRKPDLKEEGVFFLFLAVPAWFTNVGSLFRLQIL